MSDVKGGVLFWLCAWLLLAVLMFLTFAFTSCATTPVSELPVIVSPEIQTVIKNISWVQGILIIGVVGSIFACFNGAAKIGIPLLISSLVGYGLTSAMMFYAKLIALMSLVGGVTLCGCMIFLKHRALKQIITGVEEFRKIGWHDDIDTDLATAQKSKSTKQIVKKIKEKNGSS